MNRNFGLSARDDRAGAHTDRLSPRHAQGRAHSNSHTDVSSLRPFDYPALSELNRGPFIQALFDVATIGVIVIVSASIPLAVFLLLLASF